MALEVVGGAFLSAFFQHVFLKMDSHEVKNFIRGKKLTTHEPLKKLRIKMMSVSAVFDDAEQKQISNPDLKQWLHELKEAVLDAEDLMDEIQTEALRQKMEAEFGSSTSKVQELISSSFHSFDESVDLKIKEIIERLGFIAEQKDTFELKVGGRNKISQTLPSTSLVEESDVYGRDHDKEAIIRLLLSNDASSNKIGVIPIVGMGGIGKTTLAQLVFNDVRVKQHFDTQAWVCVSEEYDIVKITQTIYESITSQNCDITDLNKLQIRLKHALTGKKFLFVLDDVWNEKYNDWDSLRRPFESRAYGSKIILTTRNAGVASTMGTVQTHHLMKIREEDCWFLFAKHAFENAGGSIDPNLEVFGRQIVSKCDGLPLAAKSLGGLLRSESNEEEWENVLKSDIWELSDEKSGILPALWLSYQYLSPDLKRCFAYCSIFPKDYEFRKSELVLLWMAEDLLHPSKKKMMEEVGEKYFDDLISRSFFQHSSSNYNCFIMHDLINDLAKFVSGEFCIRLEDIGSIYNVSKARHFSYMKRSYEVDFKKFEVLCEAKYLRTFILGNQYWMPSTRFDLISLLQCLRVLKLQGYHMKELPDSISNLKHLRYLDLCNGTLIQQLPDTIGSLCNLQTLFLSGCKHLAELPGSLRRLINLRHLDIRGTKIKKMPNQMGNLKDLQTLGGEFVLDKHTGRNIAELNGFQHLRGVLHISGLQNVVHAKDALEAKVRDKTYLRELILKWEGDTEDSKKEREVLENLQPPTNLKELRIQCYGGTTFPDWLSGLSTSDDHGIGKSPCSNLASFQLVDCTYCLSMPSLGQLSSLKELEITGLKRVESVGSEFYGGIKPAFRSLQVLKFKDMKEWKEWSFAGDFPDLRELRLVKCPKLTGKVPLDYFPRLEVLKLHDVGIESLACSQECDIQCRVELLFLRELNISKCQNLVCFVGAGGQLLAPKLVKIEIFECKSLWLQPEQLHISLPSLQSLHIQQCLEFELFPQESELLSLSMLSISRCRNFVGFPVEGRLLVPNLTIIQFYGCEKLKSLPEDMHNLLPSLEIMCLFDCPELKSFPERGLPPKLESLKVIRCKKLIANRRQWGLQKLTSLRTLTIDFQDYEEIVVQEEESFPEEGLLPATLAYLEISNFLNLKTLDGKQLRHLISLRTLKIQDCAQLQCLPDEGLPTTLSHLTIWDCPLLVRRCQKEIGEDWPKIAHIPDIIKYDLLI